MMKNIFFLIIPFFLLITSVNAWSTAQLVYDLCNKTYAKDFIHVHEESGLFYTNSPFVQSITYFGKGVGNSSTQRYEITLDGCTPDCSLTVKLEIGRNFSKALGGYVCSNDSNLSLVNITSLNPYFGDNINPNHNIPPSITLLHCSLGVHVDNQSLKFSPTKDALQCLDSLTSSSPGTHSGLLQIGQDKPYFFDSTNYSPAAKHLAATINNYAQIHNSIALGISVGSNAALSKLNDIKDQVVPVHEKKNVLIEIFGFLAMGLFFPILPEAEVVEVEVAIEAEAVNAERTLMEDVLVQSVKASKDLPKRTPAENLKFVTDALEDSKWHLEQGEKEDAIYEFTRADMYLSDPFAYGFGNFPLELRTLQAAKQELETTLIRTFYSDLSAAPAAMRTTTVGEVSVGSSGNVELELGSRSEPSASRDPWRNNDVSDSISKRKIIKRDSNFGGVISLQIHVLAEALKDISNNLNKSAMSSDEFVNQVNNIMSLIHSKFKDDITAKLSGTDISVLNNFILPKTLNINDLGKSFASKPIEDFLTARIISSVMTAYGAVICSNDPTEEVKQSEYKCFCNKPIGDDNCIIAGGFGDGTYDGYRDDNLALISKWRSVSDICQNINGWQFIHDACHTYKPYCPCPSCGGSKGGQKRDPQSYLTCECAPNS